MSPAQQKQQDRLQRIEVYQNSGSFLDEIDKELNRAASLQERLAQDTELKTVTVELADVALVGFNQERQEPRPALFNK